MGALFVSFHFAVMTAESSYGTAVNISHSSINVSVSVSLRVYSELLAGFKIDMIILTWHDVKQELSIIYLTESVMHTTKTEYKWSNNKKRNWIASISYRLRF